MAEPWEEALKQYCGDRVTINPKGNNGLLFRAGFEAATERAAGIALEQRCERKTHWDRACVVIAAAIRGK